MITYNWKAEFSQSELDIIEFHKRWHNDKNCFAVGNQISTLLISEMANALDRYESILNEMEEYWEEMKRYAKGNG